jgi:hypothetical protein
LIYKKYIIPFWGCNPTYKSIKPLSTAGFTRWFVAFQSKIGITGASTACAIKIATNLEF